MPPPKFVDFRSAILNAGYHCSLSHCNSKSLKTDAPIDFLWDVVRAFVGFYFCVFEEILFLGEEIRYQTRIVSTRNSGSCDFVERNSVRIFWFNRECLRHEIDFKLHPEALAASQKGGLLRFQVNKGKNMGPRSKAKGSVNSVFAGFQYVPPDDSYTDSSEEKAPENV